MRAQPTSCSSRLAPMKRKLLTHQAFMKTTTMGFIVLASTLFASHTFAAPADRPNVILIYTDDHGYTDLGCTESTSTLTRRSWTSLPAAAH